MNPSKRDQIVEAAHRMFLDQGFGASSMDAIAAAANVSKRTVYSHFDNKETLFGEVVGQFCQRMSGAMHPIDDELPIQERLTALGRQLCGIILHPEAMAVLRMVMAEKDQFPSLAQTFWEAGPKRHLDQIATILANALELAPGDPQLAARQFAGMLKGPYFLPAMLGTESRPSNEAVEAHIELVVERFLMAVGKGSSASGGKRAARPF